MKTKDFGQLRNKDVASLKKLSIERKLDAVKAKMATLASREKNTKLALNIRREIAKILTLIKEKEIIEQLNKKGESKGL
ncbi:MAG: 50S ribosomal protein L29 [Candidatus Woesebacteria bacterium GW2011_GWA2_40_7b]|uniref:Large ribosomal subunit protein uL29 n=1 Tax=Candidatus Woesebacteria bacterium GW2011_GWA2_40_7b TaxID=1618563 RepID=A0A0G0T2P5_9BACT|nr:MAG: 50S ribosomal protein L29 [Candidatus Woesebacteria bacterium GW2011_GWA2_40_7b]